MTGWQPIPHQQLRIAKYGVTLPYIWMLIGSIFFAVMALLAESVKEQFSFSWITIVRSGVATILALGLALAAGAKLVFWKPTTLWARSISGWTSMIFGFYAMTHYDVEIVLAITNSYPIWVAVLSWPLLGVFPQARTWLALLVSCAGVWLVYSSSLSVHQQPSTFSQPHTAIPAAILASMLSGVALINLHRLKDIDARAIVAHFSAVATTCSFVVWLALPVANVYQPVTNFGVMRLIGVGLAATVGQLCLTKAFSTGSPANVSIVGLSQVAVAAIFKWILEQRVPSAVTVLGMLLILASTLVVMLQNQVVVATNNDAE
jgi:drug/metabolite transporter (DMT)-like permease